LENQYQYYLKRVGLSESRMHPQQRGETKRVFFAACAQMLILFRDGLGNIEDDNEAIRAMYNLLDQTETFWIDDGGIIHSRTSGINRIFVT